MRAAIYARKSTDEGDFTNEAKSVNRQIEGARAFIASKAWTLDDAHVYTDDGVSGALFLGRPEFQRLMRDAAAGEFEAVVFFDIDRFGRNGRHTYEFLHQLADAGVEVWDYSTGNAIDLDSFEGDMMTFMRARFAQQYRDQVRKHTRAAMRAKAEQGFVAGGRVFGYINECVAPGKTIRRIHSEEAEVVREIYARYVAGDGLRTIAEALNRRAAPSPRSQQGRPKGWSFGTVREVLMRPLYRGELVYGRTKSAYGRELGKRDTANKKREKGQLPTPEDTWLRRFDETLRIIDPALAARADAKRLGRRERYFASLAQPGAKVPERAHGTYLLSGGMLVCPTCGGHFEGVKTLWKGGLVRKQVYVCSTRRRKPGVCPNTLELPMALADNVVLNMVEGEVLGTRMIEELLALVDEGDSVNAAHLTADRERLQREVSNLLDLVAAGTPAGIVAPKIRDRELQLARIDAQLRAPRRPRPNIDRLREALTLRAKQWRATLRNEPKVARVLVRRLIEPLVLHDESERPEWVKAETAVQPALLEAEYDRLASPPGFEPGFQP